MARCPTCDRDIDPAHAPVAKIVGAKILTFCSAACAAGEAAPEPEPPADDQQEPDSIDDGWELDEPAPALGPAPALTPAPAPALDETSIRRRRPRGLIIGVSAVIVLGGAAIAIIDGVSPSRSRDVNAGETQALAQADAEAVTPAADANAADELEPARLRAAAIAQLQTLRASPSPRVKRLATMALAQTRDPEAIEALATMHETETSDLNRVAIAFALARAGDARGVAALVAATGERRRDVRADAAIALTRLDDRRGDRVLRSILHIRDHKIAAAGHLARAGDEKARALLEDIYRDQSSDAESRMRAAVALGSAGVADVTDFLKETLADGRYRVGAAAALAVLGNESAREPLAQQLGLNAMRVQAAEALATLGGDVDLTPLAVALTHDDEVTRVTAAEAILILTGPGRTPENKR